MSVTISEYARRRGCSRTAVYKAIASGKIANAVTTGDDGQTLINPELADREWAGNHNPAYDRTTKTGGRVVPTDESASPPIPGDSGAATLAQAKKVKAVYDAKTAELEYRKKAGELVDRKAVYGQLLAFGRELRNAVLAVPDRVVDDMLAAASRSEAYNMLHDALAAALDEMSKITEADLAKDR